MTFNNILILSGPSGAGEDSVIDGLSKHIRVNRVVNTTTRPKREHEVDGKDYYFISTDEFKEKIQHGDFIEWAQEYNDFLYGVTTHELERVHKMDGIGIWKMEYKGVMAMREKFPDIPTVLITAPLEVLEARIRRRDAVTEEHVAHRMAYTTEWLQHTDIYDYIVENKEGQLAETISEVMDILQKEQYL